VATAAGNAPAQVSKYIHGVGDSRNVLQRIIGGGFGAGVITRLVRGYTFISRSYEPGDRIYILGFSRGAYTARALAGMICSMGLLDRRRIDLEDRENGYRHGMQAWVGYREKAGKRNSFLDYIRGASDVKVRAADFATGMGIKVVGVWDTVGALGIPDYTAGEGRSDLFQFADTKLSPLVTNGLHAVSIHEQRADFVPTLWEPRKGIREVWFKGAHADVGGGYAECGLSDVALEWMAKELREQGLRVKEGFFGTLRPDLNSRMHEPWTEVPWKHLPKQARIMPPGAQRFG
jgi:uncharacterized protein (DUF2235 family)